MTASSLLETFGFTGERQWTPVGDLSGGERRRLQLLRLLMGEPNVLVLDEPTNDLDIDTLTALEDLLDGFAGTLLVVSHDRYFLERICDTVVALLGDGTLRDLPGGVEDYLARRARPSWRPPRAVLPRVEGGPGRHGAEAPSDAAARREARKELVRIERALERAAAPGEVAARPAGRARDRLREGRPSSTPGCARCSPSATTSRSAGSRWPRPPSDPLACR